MYIMTENVPHQPKPKRVCSIYISCGRARSLVCEKILSLNNAILVCVSIGRRYVRAAAVVFSKMASSD